MAEPLRIGVEVDTSPLGELAAAAQRVAGSAKTMSDGFAQSNTSAKDLATALLALGNTAQEAEKALVRQGFSAKEAAGAMEQLGKTTQDAGNKTEEAAAKISYMDRAMASGAVRIAANELGLGQLGFAFARVGAASSAVAPILAVAFPVIAAAALVGIIDTMYTKLRELALAAQLNADAWEKIEHTENVAFQGMDTQIQHVEDKIAELTEGKVAGLESSMKHIGDGSVEMASKMEGLFGAIGTQLEKETPYIEKFREFITFISTGGAVVLQNQGELAKHFGANLAQTLDLQGTAAGLQYVSEELQNVNTQLGKDPGNKQLKEYSDQLEHIQDMLVERKQVEDKEKSEKGIEVARAEADIRDKMYEDGVRMSDQIAKNELGLMDRLKSAGLPLSLLATVDTSTAGGKESIEQIIELTKKAAEEFKRGERENAEESKKDAREAMEAWQLAAETRIKGEEEAFRVQQENAGNRMRDIKAQESLQTAGVNKGPITSVIESGALQQQGAVAAAAMQQADAAALEYATQLQVIKDRMVAINQNALGGPEAFRDLEKQAGQLQHMYDGATQASQRWGTTLDQIKAKMAELQSSMGFSMQNIRDSIENASQAGWNSFNSAFVKMMAGGESFTRVMQTMWTSMVNSFITSILKMAEYYVEKYVIMAAVQKLLGTTSTASAAANIAESEAERQAAIGAAAAEAAVSAAIGGPAAAIAAAAITMGSLEGITAYEKGGIVTANLHEGEMVLPAHISTFVQTAAAGAAGGQGGRGGPGGPGGAAGHTFNFNHYGSGSPSDVKSASKEFMKTAMKELRRRNIA